MRIKVMPKKALYWFGNECGYNYGTWRLYYWTGSPSMYRTSGASLTKRKQSINVVRSTRGSYSFEIGGTNKILVTGNPNKIYGFCRSTYQDTSRPNWGPNALFLSSYSSGSTIRTTPSFQLIEHIESMQKLDDYYYYKTYREFDNFISGEYFAGFHFFNDTSSTGNEDFYASWLE